MTIILKPRKFRVGGRYRLSDERPSMYATIIKIRPSPSDPYPIVARLTDKNNGGSWVDVYTEDGRFFSNQELKSQFDLVPGEI